MPECECSSEPVPMFFNTRVIVLHHNSRIRDRPARDCCTLSQRQNGYSVVPEHPHVGPHGPNRASFFMNPMYSIARTRQCPRKSCSPRQPMAAYMWNGLQPVTSFTLIPNPNPNPIRAPGNSCGSSGEGTGPLCMQGRAPNPNRSPSPSPSPNPSPSPSPNPKPSLVAKRSVCVRRRRRERRGWRRARHTAPRPRTARRGR